jgi:hypothetical protein
MSMGGHFLSAHGTLTSAQMAKGLRDISVKAPLRDAKHMLQRLAEGEKE